MPASYNIVINLLVSDLYYFDPLHPNISIHIFHTALFTFVMVLARRIYLITKATVVGDHFLHSHNLDVCFSSNTVRRNRMLVTAGI